MCLFTLSFPPTPNRGKKFPDVSARTRNGRGMRRPCSQGSGPGWAAGSPHPSALLETWSPGHPRSSTPSAGHSKKNCLPTSLYPTALLQPKQVTPVVLEGVPAGKSGDRGGSAAQPLGSQILSPNCCELRVLCSVKWG